MSAFATLVKSEHRQLHQEVVESRPVFLKVPGVAGAEVPAVRFLHEAVFLSQPIMFHELSGPVSDFRSRISLLYRNSLSPVISYPYLVRPEEEAYPRSGRGSLRTLSLCRGSGTLPCARLLGLLSEQAPLRIRLFGNLVV